MRIDVHLIVCAARPPSGASRGITTRIVATPGYRR